MPAKSLTCEYLALCEQLCDVMMRLQSYEQKYLSVLSDTYSIGLFSFRSAKKQDLVKDYGAYLSATLPFLDKAEQIASSLSKLIVKADAALDSNTVYRIDSLLTQIRQKMNTKGPCLQQIESFFAHSQNELDPLPFAQQLRLLHNETQHLCRICEEELHTR